MYYMQAVEYANEKIFEKHGEVIEWTKELNNEFIELVAKAMNKIDL